MYRFLSTLVFILILAGCNSSESQPEETKPPIIEEPKDIVSLPKGKVGVYPLGEPGLSNFFAGLERDNNGIILMDAHGHSGSYEPGMIAKFAMATYRKYLSGGDDSRIEEGLKHTDWLVDNIHCDGNKGYWLLEAPLDSLVVWESPFKSAMTNGLSIFALTQMLEHTDKKEEYLATIECALKAFSYDISDDGVSSITDEYTWFEEYAMESRSKVLNGGIFALTGVWAAKEYLNSEYAAKLFDKMVAALELRIEEYDYGHTTLYHTNYVTGKYTDFGRPVHGQYNEIHALQLQWLYSETGSETLLKKAKHFYGYESYEIKSVTKNGVDLPKMTDPYKYHSYDVFTANDEFKIELKPNLPLQEIHLFYYGYHTTLPEISVSNSQGEIQSLQTSDVKYFQDNNHHTSVGIYKLKSSKDFIGSIKVEFGGFTYTDNYNRNLLRQVEVLTDDQDYFWQKYAQWAKQGGWKQNYPINFVVN
ncbi:D-glucuronyl C5-epimerase family protein [Colwellia sp. MEBiC06753]